MIEGKKKQLLLTKEAILDQISETDIVQGFWPPNKPLKFNSGILSPFRNEGNESFLIGYKGDNLTYKDLGDYNYRGDVWNFVKQIEHLADFPSVLKCIDKRFKLGLSDGTVNLSKEVITWQQPEIKPSKPPHIHVITRNFNQRELKYWESYYQGLSDLRREHIYVPREIFRNRRRIPLGDELTFCYWYPEIERWKIYRPFAPKMKNAPIYKRKWDTNITPFDYVEHLKDINGAIGIVAKSRKDRMVLYKALNTNSICVVNAEDPSCLSDESVRYITQNSDSQIIVSDNDEKGKQFSWFLTKTFGWKHCNVPDNLSDQIYKPITDFAHLALAQGLEAVTSHFRSKNIIC